MGTSADGLHARGAHHPRAARRGVGVHGPRRQLPRHQEATTPTRCCSPSAGRSTWRSRSRSAPSPARCSPSSSACSGRRFMGRFGDAFGIPFAIEGLFFFTEAIFLAIYIYGWKRLKPWPHFWTGVPIVIAGIGGTVSVVAANAWMNEPAGFTLNQAGKVVDVDPLDVIFNKAMPLRVAAHARRRVPRRRFPHRFGVRGRRCCAAGATATTASASSSRSPSPRSPRRCRCSSATSWPGGSTTTSPPSSRPSSSCRRRATDVPETLFGHLNSDGTVSGGIDDPRARVDPVRSRRGHGHADPGSRLASRRARGPTTREVNAVHLAWDVMVGLGHAAVPARRSGTASSGCSAGDMPEEQGSSCAAAAPGSRRSRDGGGLGGHRGRAPTLDRRRLHEGRRRRPPPTRASGSRSS